MATKSSPKKYANKPIVFDNIDNSMQYNPVGTIGFSLMIFSLFLGLIPVVGIILTIVGLVMSIIGLMKKPNGFALIGVIIFGVEFVSVILFAMVVFF